MRKLSTCAFKESDLDITLHLPAMRSLFRTSRIFESKIRLFCLSTSHKVAIHPLALHVS